MIENIKKMIIIVFKKIIEIINTIQECKSEGIGRTAPGFGVRLEYPRQIYRDKYFSGHNNKHTTNEDNILPHILHYRICSC